MKKFIAFCYVVFLLCSCSKEKVIVNITINDFIQSLDTNTAEIARCRLALAKIVSIAFEDNEFAGYFKENFGTVSSHGFFYEELLLINHLDDIVKQDGTNLKSFLNGIQDLEVNELFGNSLIDQILVLDPRVTIKLPDLFLAYDWEEQNTRPVVYACYQARPIEDYFIGYFNGEAVDKKMALSLPDLFHVNIKASDDLVLLRTTDLRDVFNDDLMNYLPQLRECQHIYDEIINESPVYDSWTIVDLRRAFHKWQESCGFMGSYLEAENCSENCQRHCSIPSVQHYVLDHFTMNDFTWFWAVNTTHFQETFSFWAQYRTIPLGEPLPTASIPVVRISELGLMYDVKDNGVDNKMGLPFLTISRVNKPDEINAIPFKHHFANGDDIVVETNASFIHHGDRFFVTRDLSPQFQNQFNSALAVNIGTSIYGYCEKDSSAMRSGGFKWVFRF